MKRMLAGFFFKSGLLRRRAFALRSFLLVLILVLTALPAVAQEQADPEPQVQIQTGQIFAGERMYYLLPGLRQGDRLYARMSNASGNLDPLLLLARPGAITAESLAKMRADLDARTAAGEDSVLALREVLTANFLAGNDNYGAGATAAFGYEVPEDGDYLLLALGSLIHETAGAYELVIGLNAPQILDDPAVKDSGAEIAMLDKEASGIDTAVQEIHGALPAGTPQWFYTIPRLEAGDTLYVFVEPLAGDFIPVLRLQDYSGRPLREENSAGQASTAGFQYPVAAQNNNFRIVVEDWQAANAGADAVGADLAPAQTAETPRPFRLLVGLNEPSVLDGTAMPSGRQFVTDSLPVTVRAELEQITGVDQIAENYGGVYYLQMDWRDPSQAFDPDSCQCSFKSYAGPAFTEFVKDGSFVWPNFVISNQQNNRWIQNQGLIIQASGDMTYFERFTTTLQAPEFNFRSYPFDKQQFFLRVDSLYPRNFFTFEAPRELSVVGDTLGEEEWQVTGYDTEVTDISGLGALPNSRFSFGFQASRHLNFYIMRIFVPTLLIIFVSYLTFFLKDYSKRIDVASANLLVFVAFNFTISSELPRLGYLTFIDAMLASVFIVTALVVAFNVYLRRLEITGRQERARQIDGYTLWLYPALYVLGAVLLVVIFLL